MFTRIDSFFITVIAPGGSFGLAFTLPFPQARDVHATISLSSLNTSFIPEPNPHFYATSWIESFTAHVTGGGEGPRIFTDSSSQNAISVRPERC